MPAFPSGCADGNDVPPERLERRFRRPLKNLAQALKFVPEVHVFDDSLSTVPFRLVLTLRNRRTEFAATPLSAWLAPVAPSRA